jgi:hypothetical protein
MRLIRTLSTGSLCSATYASKYRSLIGFKVLMSILVASHASDRLIQSSITQAL